MSNTSPSDLIGGQFFDPNLADPSFHPADNNGFIGVDDLRRIQKGIKETVRPRHQAAPPSNLGEASHGKLKADQWRTLMEFDIPVSLVELCSEIHKDEDEADSLKRRKMLECTMFLATALCWATSHRTSEKHASEYMRNMRVYLSSLWMLFPDRDLRPNHHSALFIGEMLLRFGPVHGWWCFPFERIIGLLQQINTNSKLGTHEQS